MDTLVLKRTPDINDQGGRIMKPKMLKALQGMLLLVIIMTSGATPHRSPQEEKDELTSYVKAFFQGVDRKRERLAITKIVPELIKQCSKRDIDPLLIATIITRESAWTLGAIGKLGEVGLMQVYSREFMKGHDMRTIKGQLGAGLDIFSFYLKKCEDTRQALNAFRTGQCTPIRSRTNERWARYEQAIKEHRLPFSD
jgi:hypothetical protein